jgi:proteic killer suppression protein
VSHLTFPRTIYAHFARPGNRLEQLGGARRGPHSIRINDQWRLCFRWVEGEAEDVEIVDYH